MFDEEYTFSKSEISILKELAKGKQTLSEMQKSLSRKIKRNVTAR